MLRYRFNSVSLLSVIAVALLPLAVSESINLPPPSPDPFADPRNDPYNPLRYIASNVATSVALSLYSLTTLALLLNTYMYGAKYMLAMPLGGVGYCIGLCLRYGLHKDPRSTSLYIPQYMFIVLSPCAFIAAVYVLLGRLATHLNAGRHLVVPARRVTLVFVASDFTTFLIQATGGGMASSRNLEMRNTGSKIFLAGLSIQLASFISFTSLLLLWAFRVYKYDKTIWQRDVILGKPLIRDWRVLFCTMLVSCVGILIRSCFRVIENSQGFTGRLATSEGLFYALDGLPLLIAVIVYVPFWPGHFINNRDSPIFKEEVIGNVDQKLQMKAQFERVVSNDPEAQANEKSPTEEGHTSSGIPTKTTESHQYHYQRRRSQ